MIPLFRKLRRDFAHQGKSSKYVRYAIGEIVLVVIGILIALQINNWNESQKTKKSAIQQLQTIAQNLEEDLIQLNYMKKFTDTTLLYSDLLSRQFQTLDPIDSLTSKCILWLVLEKQTNPNKSGYEALSNSEALGNIPVEIKELLFQYYNGLENIKAREDISNTFIKNRYEPYFFAHYSYLINKHTKWLSIDTYFINDPREGTNIDAEQFLKDGELEAMVFGRHFQISQQNTLYDGSIKVAQELLQRIRTYH
jgi:Family of unknown function (DUF6090)